MVTDPGRPTTSACDVAASDDRFTTVAEYCYGSTCVVLTAATSGRAMYDRGCGMAKRKKRVRQAEVVQHFAARLRELRRSRGLSQAELARQATVTPTYITKLESGSSAPNIDTVARLAAALGVGMADLLPEAPPADPADVLRRQAHRLADALIDGADRETLQMLCPLLARLAEAPARSR